MKYITSMANLESVARQADQGISEVENIANQGRVGSEIASPTSSYLYIDSNGVLKFYNKATGVTSSVDLT